MELCINEMCFAEPELVSDLKAAAAAGFPFMEVKKAGLTAYLKAGHSLADVKELFAENGVHPACLNSVESITFNGKRGSRVLREMSEYLFWMCRETGIPRVELIASFKVPTADEEEIAAETAEVLGDLAALAGSYGIVTSLEFMATAGSSVKTLGQTLDIVRRTGESAAGILFDTWHHAAGGGTPEEIAAARPGEITMVHVSDCPKAAPFTLPRPESYLPGRGEAPLKDMLRAVSAAGYGGPVSLEIMSPAFKALPKDEAARQAYAAGRKLLEAL